MVETELKFQVPAASRAALQRAVATPSAQTLRLRAQYFDTPDGRLAAAGVALRLRQEGAGWVQTLKGARAGLAQRLEHEVTLPAGPVALDLRRHDGTPAAAALQEALGADAAALVVVFQTDVRRSRRVLHSGGAVIEAALDIGTIRAAGRRLPLWELELELRRGPIEALYALASRWVQRHGLWLDVRSKAERGVLLARGLDARPPVGARAPALQRGQPMDAALRAMVGAALAQALPNASALAGGVGGPEHLHQLRVGLRRLRSVLQLFGRSGGADPGPDPLQGLFRRLGGARDRDVLATTVWPALLAAGGPVPSLPPGTADDPGALLREPATVCLLLDLMAFAEGAPHAEDTAPVQDRAAAELLRQHRRLRKAARGFATLDNADRHRLRRRLKRLRYGVEATQPLWPDKACRHYLDGLHPLQDALGLCNDLQVAQALLPTPDDEASRFAQGWLKERQAQAADAAARALQHWPRAPKAWRS